MDALVAVLAVSSFAVLTVVELQYGRSLTGHRTDIEPGSPPWKGRSMWAQVNLMSPSNYDAAGRSKLQVLYLLVAARLVSLVLAVAFAIRAFL